MFIIVSLCVLIYTLACAVIIMLLRDMWEWARRHPFWGQDIRNRHGEKE